MQSLSVTGFILFIMGLVTLTPEIYLSGIMVMVTSVGLTMKHLEEQRIEANTPVNHSTYETYGSW